MCILILLFVLFIIMIFNLKSKNNSFLWPLSILKYCLPILFVTFFGQTFLLIISSFELKKIKSYYNSSIFIYIIFPFSFISLIIQILFSFLTVAMYYIPDYIINKKYNKSILRKSNNKSDIYFLLCKIIIIMIFTLDKKKESEHFAILIIISLITGFNAYNNIFYQNYSNKSIKLLNNLLSLTLFWSFFNLLIKKILQSFKFTGEIYLLILGFFLIVLYNIYNITIPIDFLKKNFININSSLNSLEYINQYLKIIEEKDLSRDSLLIFNSYISKIEEECTNKRCVLKKYLEAQTKGIFSKFLLLQYAEKLFKIAISKFPKDTILRINYAIFLYNKINKKKEGKKEFESITSNSLFDNLNLYIGKKYMEELSFGLEKNEENLDNLNINQNLEYKNYSKEFKILIAKSASLFYDFWSALYNYHIQGIEDFTKLNNIGNQINLLIKDIENLFEKLKRIKDNDYDIIKLYESFSKEVLNNKEKYKKYHNILINLILDKKFNNKEIDFLNFDLNIINENDDNHYLIISVNEENKGIIKNISTSSCSIFGYQKHEIIGRNINILIPEVFHKIHDKIIKDLCEKSKTKFYESLVNKLIYEPEYTELFIHAKNKSKYLIPLFLRIYLVKTEENELVFITEIKKNNCYKGELAENFFGQDINNDNICCILTDNNLKIQTFTSNCLELLKLSSNIINSNNNISCFIKELNNDILTNKDDLVNKENENDDKINVNESNKITNNSNLSNNFDLKKIKDIKKLLKTKFSYPNQITWIKETSNQLSIIYKTKRKSNKSFLFNSDIFYNNNENNFIMQVREACISNKLIGYYFYLKKLKNLNKINKDKIMKTFLKSKTRTNFKAEINYFLNEKENSKYEETNINSYVKSKSSFHIKENNNNLQNENNKYNENFSFQNNIVKRSRSKIEDYEEEQLNKYNINPNYIPNCQFNFILELNSMSYTPSNNINSFLEIIEILKNESIQKINITQNEEKTEVNNKAILSDINKTKPSISEEDHSSDDYSNSDVESSEGNYSNVQSNTKEEINTKNKKIVINKEEGNNNVYEDQYYKVNMKNIKLIIYDFNLETFVENSKEFKISEIEYKINEYKLDHNKINSNEDEHNPKTKKKNDNNENLLIKEENENKLEKEKYFEKEIIDALSKKEDQKTITNFYIAAFISFLLILSISILELLYIVNKYLKLVKYTKLVINSANLKYYNNYNIYFLRELSLCSLYYNVTNGSYFNFPSKNDLLDYSSSIYNITNNSFFQSHSILESIFSSDISFSSNSSYTIFKKPYLLENLYYDNKIKNISSTLSVSIIQLFATFCNLISSINFSIYNPEIFNFIHNGLNNLGNMYDILHNLFMLEIKNKESGILKNIIFLLVINSCVYIIIYYLFSKTYILIINKKMSYLDAFYGIRLPIIKSSMQKCELFINRVTMEDKDVSNIDNESSFNSISISKEIFNDNNIQNDKDNNKKKTILTENNLNNTEKYTKIFLILSYLFFESVLILYIIFNKVFSFSSEYIFHLQNYHTNILYLFNSYREFLYDENSIIFGLSSYEFLIKKEEEFYSSSTKDVDFLASNNGKIRSLHDKYLLLIKTIFCNKFIIDYFENKDECLNYIGAEGELKKFGFHFLVHNFIEDIRIKRNYIELLNKQKLIIGNLSDSNYYSVYNNEILGLNDNTELIFRLNLFNIVDIHSRLNTIFIHIILQYLEEERKTTFSSIEDNFANNQFLYIILILSHIIIIILFASIFLIPQIKKMNIEIYKAKNILSIIPLKILSSISNIKIILNISAQSNQYINEF